jgi:sterol desaturase/sphingolipid hydroxylase (fatty acid hydroxylase superfamily)
MPSHFSTGLAWSLALFSLVYVPQVIIKPYWESLTSPFTWWTLFYSGNIVTNLACILLYNLLLLPAYSSPSYDKYRCGAEGGKPWPWRSEDKDVRAEFWANVQASLLLVSFNATVVAYSALYVAAPIATYLGAFSTDAASFPATPELLLHLTLSLFVEDFMFYCTHRALHTPWGFKHIHSYHHAYKEGVVALSSEHAHPLEYLVGNLIPVITGPLLLRSHMFTLWMFVFVRVTVSHDEHCGFTIPWSPVRLLPFGSSAAAHTWHHRYNLGMYASQFSFWDALLGTDKLFKEHGSAATQDSSKAT